MATLYKQSQPEPEHYSYLILANTIMWAKGVKLRFHSRASIFS